MLALVEDFGAQSFADSDNMPENKINWTGTDITRLGLYRRKKDLLRFDVFPFIALYIYVLHGLLFESRSRFVGWTLLFTSISLHVLTFLLQYWSLKVKVWVSLNRIDEVDVESLTKEPIFVFVAPKAHRGKPELIPLSCSEHGLHFSFQKTKYLYCASRQSFDHASFPLDLPLHEYSIASASELKKWGTANLRLFKYGKNSLIMPIPSFWHLYKDHLLAPFFVFQVFSIILWVFEDQWQYSALTLSMMLVFEATVCQARLRSLRELRGLRNRPRNYFVYRNMNWTNINSSEILPGDLVSIDRGRDESDVVPCDLILLSSNVVVDEAMLTGESVPTLKESTASLSEIATYENLSMEVKHKNHILFGGTRVLKVEQNSEDEPNRSMKTPDGGALCLALRTGFGTSQGELLKTIMYSTEAVTANSREAAYFILFLLMNALAASAYVLYHRYSEDSDVRYKLLLRCILIVTSVVPPELPMQLSLAVNSSLIALAQTEVFCTEPFRIPHAGKIDVCCFDKTGTLTRDDFNVIGVACPSSSLSPEEEFLLKSPHDSSSNAQLVMAACHSLIHVDGRLVGDSLELAALDAVEWNYGRTETCFPKRRGAGSMACRIIRRYRFSSELQRMSVIVQVSGEVTDNRVLTKGSPEAIRLLLRSVPDGYEMNAQSLTRRGMRVLALALKNLDDVARVSDLSKVSRSEAESDLEFAGFVCFESPLRLDSRKVVRKLVRSSHHVIMITGDSTLTATHVAMQVGMVSKPVLILEGSNSTGSDSLEWVSAKTGKRKKRFDLQKVAVLSADFDLCVSGPALREAGLNSFATREIAKHITIFARVTPTQKEIIVTALNDSGLWTLMCGDGTNDVGALKQAHVGVALLSSVNTQPDVKQVEGTSSLELRSSNRGQTRLRKRSNANRQQSGVSKSKQRFTRSPTTASDGHNQSTNHAAWPSFEDADLDQAPLVKLGDASIASPFTSRRLTVDSCVSVIRQGRCTLATTMQMYQILALNGLIQAFSLSVLYLEGVSFGERQMTVTGICLAFAFFMISRSKSLKKLSPEKPPTSIFAPALFLSLLAQVLVHVSVLWMSMQFAKQYESVQAVPDAKFQPSVFNTVVFLVSAMQQVAVMAVNYKGRPFMEGLSDNKGLRYSLLFVSGIVLICTLEVLPEINQAMQCAPMPSFDLQLRVIGLCMIDICLSWVFDFVIRALMTPKARKKIEPGAE